MGWLYNFFESDNARQNSIWTIDSCEKQWKKIAHHSANCASAFFNAKCIEIIAGYTVLLGKVNDMSARNSKAHSPLNQRCINTQQLENDVKCIIQSVAGRECMLLFSLACTTPVAYYTIMYKAPQVAVNPFLVSIRRQRLPGLSGVPSRYFIFKQLVCRCTKKAKDSIAKGELRNKNGCYLFSTKTELDDAVFQRGVFMIIDEKMLSPHVMADLPFVAYCKKLAVKVEAYLRRVEDNRKARVSIDNIGILEMSRIGKRKYGTFEGCDD